MKSLIKKKIIVAGHTFKIFDIIPNNFSTPEEYVYYFECDGIILEYNGKNKKWRCGINRCFSGHWKLYHLCMTADNEIKTNFGDVLLERNTAVEALYDFYGELSKEVEDSYNKNIARMKTLKSIYEECKIEMNIKDIIE